MWSNKYIGIPFKEKGRDFSGVDCWGLVRLIYKEEFNIDLPSFVAEYGTTDDTDRLEELIAQYKEAWEPIATPVAGSVALFKILGSESHIVVALNENEFIHVSENSTVVIEKFNTSKWKSRLVGFFKYNPNKTSQLTAVPHPLKTEKYTVPVPKGTKLSVLADWIVKEWNIQPELKSKVTILVNGRVIPVEQWETTILSDTDKVEYRAVPGKDVLRIAIVIIIAIYAPELIQWAGGYASEAAAIEGMGKFGYALAKVGVSLVAASLANAIFPVRQPSEPADAGTSQAQLMMTGGANQATPYSAIPLVLGKVKMTPPLGATNYLTFENERDSYLTMMLAWGYGPLVIDQSTLKIGDIAYSDFEYAKFTDGTNMLVTLDRQSDTTVQTDKFNAIYGDDVNPQQINLELICDGNPETTVTPGDYKIAAISAGSGCNSVTVALHFPQGLRKIKVKGDDAGNSYVAPVGIEMEYRLSADAAWIPWKNMVVGDDSPKKDAFTLTYTLGFATRVTTGVQVRVRRTTGDNTEDNPDWRYSHNVVFLNANFINNTYPAVDPKNCKIAKTALRIKANDQFNGSIQGINAVVQTYCQSYNGSIWRMAATNNPADLFRYVLQHPANPQRILDTEVEEKINLTQLQYWWNYCNTARSYTDPDTGITTSYTLTYNAVISEARSILEVLRDICAAGRASPAMVDGKWTVVIDEPRTNIIQHFTPHNSWGFEGNRGLPKLPDGLKVTFFDENQNYQQVETIIYKSGKDQTTAELFESITLPGVTKKEIVIDHARWHMAQAQLRRETYVINTDIEYLVCNRGDRVKVMHDVPMWGVGSGRIKNRISLQVYDVDEPVPIAAASTYTARIRNASGSSIECTVLKSFNISSVQRLANIVTVTFSGEHPFVSGDYVTVGSSVSTINGTFLVLGVTTNTITYEMLGTNVSLQSASGTCSLPDGRYSRVMFAATGNITRPTGTIIQNTSLATEIQPLDLFLFGLYQQESQDLIVLNIEPSSNKTARLTLVDYGVTSTYNIFTDYKSLTSNTVFNTNITLPPELNRTNYRSTDKPTVTALTSNETAAEIISPGVYNYRIRVAFANTITDLPTNTTSVECQYDLASATNSANYKSLMTNFMSSTVYIPNVLKGQQYKLRLRYIASDGSTGPWTSWYNTTVLGKQVAPSTPTNFSYTLKETGIQFKWDSSTDIDYSTTEIRYKSVTAITGSMDTEEVMWQNSTKLVDGNLSSWVWTTPTTGMYAVTIKHKDSTGNYSSTPARVLIDYTNLVLASLQVELSNPVPVIPILANSTTPVLTGSGLQIKVLQGGTALKYDNVGTLPGRWKINKITDGTGITSGAKAAVSDTTNGDNYATIADATAFTATSSATVTYEITGKTTLGDAFTLTKVLTYYTVKPSNSASIVYAYKRSATNPKSTDGSAWSPGAVDYSFLTASITTTPLANGWSKTITAGVDPLWVTAAAASSNSGTDGIADNEWTDPIKYVENGSKTAIVRLYARNSSTTSAPTLAKTGTATYTFATASLLNGPNGWTQTIPAESEGNVIWTTQAVAVGTDLTCDIANSTWSDPVEYGRQGDPGISSAVVYVYKRSAVDPNTVVVNNVVTPDKPGAITYSFATNQITTDEANMNGWKKQAYAGTDPLWVRAATAASNKSTDTIANTEWSDAIKYVENGLTTATVFLYARNSSVTDAPTLTRYSSGSVEWLTTYTFSDGSVANAPTGWSRTIPDISNGPTIWVIQATAANTTTTDVIKGTEWSTPTILNRQGAQGPRSVTGYVYFSDAQAAAPNKPTASNYNFTTGVFTELTTKWSTSITVASVAENNANQKYWASKFTVTEATFGAASPTITFEDPSTHLNLSGIVTFTNLTNHTDSSGTSATIIDGGGIKTGTIEADRIKADQLFLGHRLQDKETNPTFVINFKDKYISITV